MSDRRTILIDGSPCLREAVLAETGTAANVNVRPGHLLEYAQVTQGGIDYNGVRLNRNSTQGFQEHVMVAVEDTLTGKTVNDSYETGGANAADIADSETVRYAPLRRGDRFLARVAAGEAAITFGNSLKVNITAGQRGCVEKAGAVDDVTVAVAVEDLDNSAGTTEVLLLCEAM